MLFAHYASDQPAKIRRRTKKTAKKRTPNGIIVNYEPFLLIVSKSNDEHRKTFIKIIIEKKENETEIQKRKKERKI